MANNKIKTLPKAAVLVRESRDNQDPISQLQMCLNLAKRNGYVVPKEYVFVEHITGMDKGETRLSVQQLQEAVERYQDISAVFCTELTRLSRNANTLVNHVEWFNRHNVPIYFDDLGMWTIERDSEGNLRLNDFARDKIYGAATYGEREWKRTRTRTIRGRRIASKKTNAFLGIIADGYKVVLDEENNKTVEVDSTDAEGNLLEGSRAALIKRIFDLYTVKGLSTNAISELLNTEGVPTFSAMEAYKHRRNRKVKQTVKQRGINASINKSDIQWTKSTIGQILKNRWYIGERVWHWKKDDASEEFGEDTIIYHHTPIVSIEQFEAAQSRLQTNKKDLHKKRKGVYPLCGIFYCGTCGRRMDGHRVRVNSSYYCSSVERQPKCGAEGICKENADAIVWAYIQYIPLFYLLKRETDWTHLFSVFSMSQIDKDALLAENNKLGEKLEKERSQLKLHATAIAKLAVRIAMETEESIVNALKEREKELRRTITNIKEQIASLKRKIDDNESILKADQSVEDSISSRIDDITERKDITAVSEIIHQLIRKITLYNLTSSYKLIEIEIASNRKFYALYNSRRLKNKYIQLPFNQDDLLFDKERNVFKARKYALGWHEWGIKVGDKPWSRRSTLRSFTQEELEQEKVNYPNHPYLVGEFTVEELISLLDFNKREYERGIVRVEAEPSDEEYQNWKFQYREWALKRKAQKRKEAPSKMVVLKDKEYDKIEEKRQLLYKKRYRVKHKANISEEERNVLLSEINEQLKQLNAQIKYIAISPSV